MSWAEVATEAVLRYGAQQDADELAILLATLDGVIQPQCALEIGAGTGGLTWALSRLTLIERIVTVDLATSQGVNWPSTGTVDHLHVRGNSQHTATFAAAQHALAPYEPDVVIIDAAHDYSSARTDFDTWGPLCAADGLIVLHDTRGYHGRTDFGVGHLLTELQDRRPVTEVYSRRGGPAGTGLVWAAPKAHGLTYDQREHWPR